MDDIYSQKWRIFLRKIWPLRFIPFVDFVLTAGSLATGEVHNNSDFDVIVGVKPGRIFTVRFCCFMAFGLLGWRKKKNDTEKSGSDKICFNHFISPAAYRLSEPHNEYWKNLYSSLVPVFGNQETIQKFFNANSYWMGKRRIYQKDSRLIYEKGNFIAGLREKLLSGRFGNWLERIFKQVQIRKNKMNLSQENTYRPRIILNDNELEFHPHTKRIEDFCENQKK
ncbi:MAG: hypothetical protein PHP03_01795 [Candidatus Pacebacteria bacterium]|nr:hypothetical protein [Candidatus Paceibacterota bacterium]